MRDDAVVAVGAGVTAPAVAETHVGAERAPLGQGLIIVANVTRKGGKN